MKMFTRLGVALLLGLVLAGAPVPSQLPFTPTVTVAFAAGPIDPNTNCRDTSSACPFKDAAVVTPSDSTAFTNATRSIWVGTAGTVCGDLWGGETNVCFTSVSGLLPGEFTKIYATGTTASGIVAVW